MNSTGRLLRRTAAACLLLSGAAGLVYQVVWLRYLALFLGQTSYAVVAVLACFMGGIALGNLLLGRVADRVERPLSLYAWLEVGIGLYALLFPLWFEAVRSGYLALAAWVAPGSGAALGLKVAGSVLLVLLPTTLMGGTLPVMTRLVTRSLGELRARVSHLYALNSGGAIAGCLLADFWWVPTVGLQATVFLGGALNLAVGALAIAVSARLRHAPATAPAAAVEPPADEPALTPPELRLAIVGVGISGFAAMLYEVVWTRMLCLAMGSSTHAFSVMVATFIAGITIGAWAVGRWRPRLSSLDAFGWAEVALAISLVLTLGFYEWVPYGFVKLAALLSRQPAAYPWHTLLQTVTCFGVMFLPTFFLGLTLPLASRAATQQLARTGHSVGTVFGANTLGTVLGTILTGLWLMPVLGLARTFFLGLALSAALGVFTLCRRQALARPRAAIAVAAFGVLVCTAFGGVFNDPWQRLATVGLWRGDGPASLAEYRQLLAGAEIRYYRDGAGATVCVHGFQGADSVLSLRVNGKTDASTGADTITQVLVGHLPALLHPAPQSALVVGLGSGMTADAVLRHPGIERADVIEILPEMVDAARCFSNYNHQVLANPKLRLVVDDAKSFLLLTTNRYDVLVSEPSNPWVAGLAGVFSREYYELCRDRLRPGGVMAQWVQSYEIDDETFTLILNTFLAVFPHVSVWQASPADLILIGTQEPMVVDLDRLERQVAEPTVRADLERVELHRLPVLLARELIAPENTLHLLPPAERIHSDYFPVLDYAAQRAFFTRRQPTLHLRFDQNQLPRPTGLLGRYLAGHRLGADDYRAFVLAHLTHQTPGERFLRSVLRRWLEEAPTSAEAAEFLLQFSSGASPAAGTLDLLDSQRDRILTQAESNPILFQRYALALWQEYVLGRSAVFVPKAAELDAALGQLVAVDARNRRVGLLWQAEVAWDRGDDAACLRLAKNALDFQDPRWGTNRFDLDPGAPARVLTRCLESELRAGRIDDAAEICRGALQTGLASLDTAAGDPALSLVCRKVATLAVLKARDTGLSLLQPRTPPATPGGRTP